MSESISLDNVLMQQSNGLKATMPEARPVAELLVVLNEFNKYELYTGTGSSVQPIVADGSGTSNISFDSPQENASSFRGTFVYFDNDTNTWHPAYAVANPSLNEHYTAQGIAVAIDSTSMQVTTSGKLTIPFQLKDYTGTPVTAGTYYYLCQDLSNAGMIQPDAPASGIKQVVCQIMSVDETQTTLLLLNDISQIAEDILVTSGDGSKYLGDDGQYHAMTNEDLAVRMTNCLLEVPQKINLELSNGTLTLKAGSKVIVPNGFESDNVTKKFDEVTVENDISFTYSFASPTSAPIMAFIKNGASFNTFSYIDSTFSGSQKPAGDYITWYNTAENLMYAIGANGTVLDSGFSFPIATIIQGSDGVTKSIDQVFNGFGYIGQCEWLDKGVKCLFADGRNADGTYKNFEFTNPELTITDLSGQTSIYGRIMYENGKLFLHGYDIANVFEQDTKPNFSGTHAIWFDTSRNEVFITSDGLAWNKIYSIVIPELSKPNPSGSITSLKPKQPFRAADYQDVVKKSGDTMTGTLTVEADGQYTRTVAMKSKTIDISTNATQTSNDGLYFIDKNGAPICWLVVQQENGTKNTFLGIGSNAIQNPNFLGFVFPKATSKPTTTTTATSYMPAVVVQNYLNGTSWYRVWSDGFCEQGGATTNGGNATQTVTFLKAYTSTPTVMIAPASTSGTSNYNNILLSVTNTSFQMQTRHTWGGWVAYGYIN